MQRVDFIILLIFILGLGAIFGVMVSAVSPPLLELRVENLESQVKELQQVTGLEEPHKLVIPDWEKRK